MMKIIIASAFCLSLAFASLTIPLKSQLISHKVGDSTVDVDTVLYATGQVSQLGSTTKIQDENILLDLLSDSNYVISSATKFGDKPVSTSAFDCNSFCSSTTKVGTPSTILGGKATVSSGVVLEQKSDVELENGTGHFKLYVPDVVDPATGSENLNTLAFANAGLSLSRAKDGLVDQLSNSKEGTSNQFSLYVHDKIAQLNIGEPEAYLSDPTHPQVRVPIVSVANSKGWTVVINEIKTKNGSQLKAGAPVNANFDSTSLYTYVPHNSPASASETGFSHFMNDKELPCFGISSNLNNKLSYLCEENKFPGFDAYNPITFTFKGEDSQTFDAVLAPSDYIQKNSQGAYELLFRLASAPQNNEFYLGTSFMKVIYPTFNAKEGVVTLAKKFNVQVPENGAQIANEYRLPVIIAGSILSLASVGALLAILQKVKVDPASFEMANYLQNTIPVQNPIQNLSAPITQAVSNYQQSPAYQKGNAAYQQGNAAYQQANTVYQQGASTYQQGVTNLQGVQNQAYNLVQNPTYDNVASTVNQNLFSPGQTGNPNALRQSQAQTRQSQVVRTNIQNQVFKQF